MEVWDIFRDCKSGIDFENTVVKFLRCLAFEANRTGKDDGGMVRCGVGAALGFDLNLAFDDLRFLPLSPAMETGTVLVWKKDQVLTPAVEAFHQHIKNVQQAY